jgi:arylsulfatase A-like enzyme
MTRAAAALDRGPRCLFSALTLTLALAFVGCPAPEAERSTPATLSPASAVEEPGDAGMGAAPRIILLISLDTLRADHLSLYGYERSTSPVLDLLAAEGVVFEDASATAPWTLPSHASILTGLTPFNHRVWTPAARLPDHIPTLASLLGEAGYETAAVVNSTWLHKQTYQLTRDFESYLGVQEVLDRREPSTWVTDRALEWLGGLGDRRLFLFVHYYDLHSDYASQPSYERQFLTPYAGEVDGKESQVLAERLQPEASVGKQVTLTNFNKTTEASE